MNELDLTGPPTATPRKVVVGVDGSDSSVEALRWAGAQAAATGATLVVIFAWYWPVTSGYAPPPPRMDLEADARSAVDTAMKQAFGDAPPVGVEVEIQEGRAARLLIEASHRADLLVVGGRGHGAFTGMLLGSVSGHCVSHAACPVVVVRHGGSVGTTPGQRKRSAQRHDESVAGG